MRLDFQRLTVPGQQAVIAFLENLVLFKLEEEDDEVVVAAGDHPTDTGLQDQATLIG